MLSLIIDICVTLFLTLWIFIALTSPMMLGGPGANDNRSNLFTIALIFFLPALIFLVYLAADKSFYRIPASYCLALSLIAAATLSLLLRLPWLLTNSLAGIPNSGYFKNEKYVYKDGKKLPHVLAGSFEMIDEYFYTRDQQHVFYNGAIIPGADPHSFESASENQKPDGENPGVLFWRDKHAVYANGKILTDAIPSDFTYLSGWYAQGHQVVYYGDKVVAEADTNTFQLLNNHLAKDAAHVFYLGQKIELDENDQIKMDLATLVLINSDSHAYTYVKDNQNVYVKSGKSTNLFVRIIDADPDTFTPLADGYAKDKARVYVYDYSLHKVAPVMGVDPMTFTVPH